MNFLVIDTETGGLNPERHSLLEVGLAAYKEGEIIGRKEFFLKEEEYHVTPKAMEVNNFRLNQVYEQGITPALAVHQIDGFVKLHFGDAKSFTLMGHNVGFDHGFLKKLFERQGLNIDEFISYRKFDTSTLIATAKVIGVLPMDAPGGLHPLADYLQIPYDSAHTAMADIELTIAVYEHIIQLLGGHVHDK